MSVTKYFLVSNNNTESNTKMYYYCNELHWEIDNFELNSNRV